MDPQPVEVTVRYLVRGTVQGVGYRYFAFRTASSLGLRGWAANLPDGRVEVMARGARKTLGSLEEALRQGPPNARVAGVDKSEISDELDGVSTFNIRSLHQ